MAASFSISIQGPAPLCELSHHEVQSTTKIDTLRLAVANHYDYPNPADIDLRSETQTLLANKTLGHYNITENDLLIVAERITSRMEPVKKRKESLEVQHKPFLSPSAQRKESGGHKIENNTSILPYDHPLPTTTTDSNRTTNTAINTYRSQSMPDLLLPSPEIKRKLITKASVSRKISVPIGMESFNTKPTTKFPITQLPTILS